MRKRNSRRLRFESLEHLVLLNADTLENFIATLADIENSQPQVGPIAPQVTSLVESTSALEVIEDRSTPLVLNTPGQVYRLDHSLRFAGNGVYIAAENVTLDLNGHTIYYGGDGAGNRHGVVLYLDWFNTEIDIPGAGLPTNARIINGNIVHVGESTNSHGIFARRAYGLLLEDLQVEVHGVDSHTLWLNAGPGTVRDSVLVATAESTPNRYSAPANVRSDGPLVATHNVLIGGNSGFNVGSNSQISGNVIQHAGFATNGYGVFLYENSGVVVADNLILPLNGRGILLNGGADHVIKNNIILHLERPNVEYGDTLNTPGIRTRYYVTGAVISGNVTLGIGGGGRTSASGLYLSNDGTGKNTYENNSFTTIVVGTTDTTHSAVALALEGHGRTAPARDEIRSNTFRSNHILIRLEGPDGPAHDQGPMIGNTFEWATGDAARAAFKSAIDAKLTSVGLAGSQAALESVNAAKATIDALLAGVPLQSTRKTWYLKWFSNPQVRATVLDSVWGAGVANDSFGNLNNTKGDVSARVGTTHLLQLKSASGAAIANTSVGVTTNLGDVFAVKTDSQGWVRIPVIGFGIDKAYESGAPFVKRARSSLTLLVAGYEPRALSHDSLPSSLQLAAAPLVDDGEPQYLESGSGWTTGGLTGGFEGDYRYHEPGTGTAARWSFDSLSAGTYDVYVTYVANANRASDASYTIKDGSTVRGTVTLNQQVAPNDANTGEQKWEKLGTFNATSGKLTVELSSSAGGVVVADAVHLFKSQNAPTISSLAASPDPIAKGRSLQLTASGVADADGTVSLVEFFRDANGNGVLDAGTDPLVATDTSGTDGWKATVSTSSLSIGQHRYLARAVDNVGGKGNTALDTVVVDLVMDDGDSTFSTTTAWQLGGLTGGYGGDYRYQLPATGLKATWKATSLAAGTYEVYVTWREHANRATNATYRAYDGSTLEGSVAVNQRNAPPSATVHGSKWLKLGTFGISSGTLKVDVQSSLSGVVVADAVRVVKVS